MRRVPRIGQKFGKWTVLKEGRSKGYFRFWLCQCTCGFKRLFTTSYLNTNQATYCDRCRQKERRHKDKVLEKNTIGRTYGTYTVVKYLGKNKYGSREWLCRCACGKERKFLSSYLFGNGRSRATLCQQCHNKKMELDNRITDTIPPRFWKRFLGQTKRRGIVVSVTKDTAFSLYLKQNKRCALSNVPLYFTKLRTNFNRYTNASIDRINSNKGYTLDNIQWVHKIVNVMKWRLGQERFVNWCKKIARHAA